MSRYQPIDEINEEIDKEQPHRREVPLQRAGQTLLVVPALRYFGPAAERHPHRELETEERLPVVDAPAAADHDEDRQRIEPVGYPYCQRMQYDRLCVLRHPMIHHLGAQPPVISTK